MTEAYYVAVKGSLHASDSSVFGLSNEELTAISKRFGNSRKDVINGILIKANPLEVINCLSELGYRVACSSGEAEMVWTLRREVLDSRSSGTIKAISSVRVNRTTSKVSDLRQLSKIDDIQLNRATRASSATFRKPERPEAKTEPKKIPRIGTKPEDIAEFGYDGSRILVVDPEEIEAIPDDQKVIIKTNLSSEDNPMLSPWGTEDVNNNANNNNASHRTTPASRDKRVNATPDVDTSKMSCAKQPPVPSVHQTIEEMDFERGLWYPALTGDLPRVKTLLRKGHNPNEEDNNGYTALHYAARCGFTTICTTLLEAGANVNKATRAGGSTPLHRASLAGNDDTVVILINYGANILAQDADGRIPLHRAVEANHPSTVAVLLEASPESVFAKDRTGKTARHYVKPGNKVMGELFDIIEKSTRPSSGVNISSNPRRRSPIGGWRDRPYYNRDVSTSSLKKPPNQDPKDREQLDKI